MPLHSVRIEREMEGKTIRAIALGCLGLSSSGFKRAKFQGSIELDGARVTADARVRAGQTLTLYVPEKHAPAVEPYALPLTIAYEDEYLWVIDKPAPLPSAHSARQDTLTLENALCAHVGQPEWIYRPVNRLDKGTSGLMAVARDAHTQHLLQRLLHTDAFVREYLAVVDGAPPLDEGVIDLPIAKAGGATVRRQVSPDGKPARTRYRVLLRGPRSLVRLRLETGRTHQIRVHLSHLGCPVTGDFLYGAQSPDLPGRFALHSAFFTLLHPITGQTLRLASPLPAQLCALLPNYSCNVHSSSLDGMKRKSYTNPRNSCISNFIEEE